MTQTPTGTPITQHFIAPVGGEASTFIDPDAKLSYKDELVVGFEWDADSEVTRVPELPGVDRVSFEDAVHNYNAIELTMDRRFSNNWQLVASYRWSRLHGTYEGFFREDNGQSDPALTSLFDFPTNDPTYTEFGVPQFQYLGDIRFLGELGEGPLPLDRDLGRGGSDPRAGCGRPLVVPKFEDAPQHGRVANFIG